MEYLASAGKTIFLKKECAARRYSESDSSCMRCFFSLNFGESGYHDYYTKRGMKKPVRTQRTYTVSELNDAFMLWVNLSVRICHFRSASSTGVSYILGAKSDWETGRDKRARAGAGSEWGVRKLLYLLFSRGRPGTRQISDGASQTRMLELNRGRENDKSQSSSNAYASCMFVLSF